MPCLVSRKKQSLPVFELVLVVPDFNQLVSHKCNSAILFHIVQPFLLNNIFLAECLTMINSVSNSHLATVTSM